MWGYVTAVELVIAKKLRCKPVKRVVNVWQDSNVWFFLIQGWPRCSLGAHLPDFLQMDTVKRISKLMLHLCKSRDTFGIQIEAKVETHLISNNHNLISNVSTLAEKWQINGPKTTKWECMYVYADDKPAYRSASTPVVQAVQHAMHYTVLVCSCIHYYSLDISSQLAHIY